mmetsp:Transcript_7185/g.13320  ORF Transcript_7185/g.13320 Transcript_7185/m.13320 type:complete len:225 (+) Transcript_7185:1415-2089(+)
MYHTASLSRRRRSLSCFEARHSSSGSIIQRQRPIFRRLLPACALEMIVSRVRHRLLRLLRLRVVRAFRTLGPPPPPLDALLVVLQRCRAKVLRRHILQDVPQLFADLAESEKIACFADRKHVRIQQYHEDSRKVVGNDVGRGAADDVCQHMEEHFLPFVFESVDEDPFDFVDEDIEVREPSEEAKAAGYVFLDVLVKNHPGERHEQVLHLVVDVVFRIHQQHLQ